EPGSSPARKYDRALCPDGLREKGARRAPRRRAQITSPRVELDDQLLLDRERDRLADRLAHDLAAERALVEREPLRHATPLDALERRHDAALLAALLTDRDRVAGAHEVARDADGLAV